MPDTKNGDTSNGAIDNPNAEKGDLEETYQDVIQDLALQILRLTAVTESDKEEEDADAAIKQDDAEAKKGAGGTSNKLASKAKFVDLVMEQVSSLDRLSLDYIAALQDKEAKKEAIGGLEASSEAGAVTIAVLQAKEASSQADPMVHFPPTRLMRNSGNSIPSPPGAFRMEGTSSGVTVGLEENLNETAASSNFDDLNSGVSSNTFLEATRVDDITVNAEAIDITDNNPTSRKRLQFMLGGSFCIVVLLVVVLATTLSQQDNNNNQQLPTETETMAPTYDPETRMSLLKDLLIQELNPLYEINYYNSTSQLQLLEDTWLDPLSPQSQALQWLAFQDSEVVAIQQPHLETGNNETQQILQRYVLAVLYYSTTSNTTAWTDDFEFLSNGTECDWSGAILCTQDTVTHLELQKNHLVGTIPLELAALTSLAFLHLGGNLLHGTLPVALAQLTKLKTLNLGFNDLTGTVPHAYFTNLRGIPFQISLAIW